MNGYFIYDGLLGLYFTHIQKDARSTHLLPQFTQKKESAHIYTQEDDAKGELLDLKLTHHEAFLNCKVVKCE